MAATVVVLPDPVAGDQHEPTGLVGHLGQHRRQAQAGKVRDVVGHMPDHEPDAPPLAENIYAEAAHPPCRPGAVGFVGAGELLRPLLRHHREGNLLGVLRAQFRERRGPEDTIDPHVRRRSGVKVKIRTTTRDQMGEHGIQHMSVPLAAGDIRHRRVLPHGPTG